MSRRPGTETVTLNFSKLRNDIEARRWLTYSRAPVAPAESLIMKVLLARFLREESGATGIDYALIAAGMSVAILTVLSGLGSKLSTAFTTVRAALE
jgi:pilus assembly protein Flp/PilA